MNVKLSNNIVLAHKKAISSGLKMAPYRFVKIKRTSFVDDRVGVLEVFLICTAIKYVV